MRVRGNEPGSVGIPVAFRTVGESMAAYDRLPKPVRESVANATHDMDVVELAQVAKKRRWSVEQMISAVEWVDARASGEAA